MHDWTVGPIFYSSIFVAEAIGQTNTSQVKDLNPNDGNEFTPAFAIYENGNLARIALINFLSDASGANDYTATIYVGGTGFNEPNGVPPSVKVKCATDSRCEPYGTMAHRLLTDTSKHQV